MTNTLVILNPAARGEKARRLIREINGLARDASVRVTSGPREAGIIADRACREEGYQNIVAAGGDGTINEVVNGIAGSNVNLGILPVGTMNVFALELGLPVRDLRQCWDIITDGNVRLVDLPRVNEHYFVQLGGIGLDAQIVEETGWELRKTFGPLSYLVSAAQIASRIPPRIKVKADDHTTTGSFVLIGNGRYYGGPVVLFGNALIDDGKLDVMVFKNLGYIDIIRYLQGVLFGNHHKLPDVEYFQTRRLTASSTEDVPVEVDGEVVARLPVKFGFSQRKLRVLAPPVKRRN